MKKKSVNWVLSLVLFVSLLYGTAFAAGSDTAGNTFESNTSDIQNSEYERDFFWAGNGLNLTKTTVGNDLWAIGDNLIIYEDVSIDGSIRAAGRNIEIYDTYVENNVTCVGQHITIASNSKAAGIYLAGETVQFEGRCKSLNVAGKTVTVDGRISGDAHISGDDIEIGDGTVITGTLYVGSDKEPVIPEGAEIANIEFTEYANDEEVAAKSAGMFVTGKLLSGLYWIPSMLILCLLLCLVMSPELNNAGIMVKNRTAPMLLSGLIAIFAIPTLLILLSITVVGLPSAGILLLLLLLISFVSITFTGASLARITFPKMNGILASVVGVAILFAARIIPFVGILIFFGSLIYFTGYLIQVCFFRILALRKSSPQNTPPTAVQPPIEKPNYNNSEDNNS